MEAQPPLISPTIELQHTEDGIMDEMYNKKRKTPQGAYELRACPSWLSNESIRCAGALCIKWRIDKTDAKDNNNWNNINSNNIFLTVHDLALTLTDQMRFRR